MQRKLTYLLTFILLSFFAVQCNDISGSGDIENTSQGSQVDKSEILSPDDNFVSARNGDFYLDGQPYRYAGTNAYYLQTYESIDPSVVDRAFDSFQNAGVTVVRMWGFYDGPARHSGDAPLQPEAGVYSEENLRLLDRVIAKGKEHGLRFIIALANYWEELGGICQYNKWAGVSESEGCGSESMEIFINGSEQQQLYKDYVKMILNRVNTETGVAYKDDPAIFSWEIINEGRNPGGDPQDLRDWYQEIAQFIKSIDSNHLVSTGEEGFEENTPAEYSKDQYSNTYVLRAQLGTSYLMNTNIPEIDYGSAHWYPGDWGWNSNNTDLHNAQRAWLSDHADIAETMNKPFLIGEYGYAGWGDSNVEEIYSEFWNHAEDIQLDGSLIWQLTADHVKCYEFGGNICWPGGRADENLYNGFLNHIQAISSQ